MSHSIVFPWIRMQPFTVRGKVKSILKQLKQKRVLRRPLDVEIPNNSAPLDPPRFGWTDASGVDDMLHPHAVTPSVSALFGVPHNEKERSVHFWILLSQGTQISTRTVIRTTLRFLLSPAFSKEIHKDSFSLFLECQEKRSQGGNLK